MSSEKTKQRILIVGGGFAGIKTALELASEPALDVTLLSDQENFRYYPSLYRAAVGGRKEASSIPLTEIFANKNVKIVKGEAVSIDRAKKTITTKSKKSLPYDKIVLALGVVTNYFGIKGLEENSYGIKTLEDAYKLRDHLHNQLLSELKPDLNYVIIGGGPTGVELAGELPGYVRHIMHRHGLEPRKIKVDLIEAAPRLISRMPKVYSKAVARRLRQLGVTLMLDRTVEASTADSLVVDGKPLASHTVIWTAGVTNHPFFKNNGFQLNDRGKVLVDQYLQAEPDIFVIGDNADTEYSGMAQTALYDGDFIGHNLLRLTNGQEMKTYKPKRPVYVTPVGSGWAAVLWGNFTCFGRFGWLLRNAADWRAYSRYESWFKASRHWVAMHETLETCPVCSKR